MKKILLITLLLLGVAFSYAQPRRAAIGKDLQNIAVPYQNAASESQGPVQNVNPYVSTRLVPDILGNTYYDLQTNGSMQQRIIRRDDGKMSAVWTRGITSTAYPDRGTGYNFFNGTAWGPAPSARIEAIRTGWPSIDLINGDGEVAVAHQAAGPLILMQRPVAGTGTWAFSNVNPPSGAPWPFWPAIMTNGANHNVIHILAMTQPVANGGAIYNNLDGALLYWRSTDGGVTWDKEGYQFTQLVAPDYIGFSADSYVWANPKGDTIAFAYGDNWSDEFIMWSPDNGNTWNKIEVLSNQYQSQPTGQTVLPFYSTDGSNSLAIDKNGIFHLAFGRMRNSEDATGRLWYPYTDGLLYWNSTMPQMQDSLNLDTLFNHNQLIAYVQENATGDSILTIPYYNACMTSYPNLTVDNENGRIIVVYSGVVVDNPSNGTNYRHIKAVGTNDVVNNYPAPAWGDMIDFNSGIDDMYLEFVFPSMAKKTSADKIHYITQSSDVPGTNILQTTVPVHDNNIIYNEWLKDEIILPGPPIGINKVRPETVAALSNFPNPFRGTTTLNIGMNRSGHAVLEITNIAGQVLKTNDLGTLTAGNHHLSFNASDLANGIYIYTVKVDGESRSARMIVN